eukprot:3587445-Pyramimonas_sp.AAC.1
MPLLRGDWAPPWRPLVCLSDASEHGFAVSASLFDRAAVKKIGRAQERSRFRVWAGARHGPISLPAMRLR